VLSPGEVDRVRDGGQPDPGFLARLDAPPAAVTPGGEPLLQLLDEDGGLVAVCRLDATGAPALAAVFPQVGPPGGDDPEVSCD
jgi:hypothetical protein